MVQQQLQSLGTNVVVIIPGSQQGGGVRHGFGSVLSLTAADSDALRRECPAVLASTPMVGSRSQVIYGNVNWAPNDILGVDVEYLVVRNWAVERGGFFTERDVHAGAKVCVVGRTVASMP